MLYSFAFLGALGIVEAVQCAHQIAGDAADALKKDALTEMCIRDSPVPPARLIEAAEQMARDCDGSWSKLLEHITGMARQELTASREGLANEELVHRLLDLQEDNRRLQQELHQAKDKIIDLLEQQAAAQAEKEAPAASMPGTARGSRPNMI